MGDGRLKPGHLDRTDLAQIEAPLAGIGPLGGIDADDIEAKAASDKEGTGQMITLRHQNRRLDAKNVAGAIETVIGADRRRLTRGR